MKNGMNEESNQDVEEQLYSCFGVLLAWLHSSQIWTEALFLRLYARTLTGVVGGFGRIRKSFPVKVVACRCLNGSHEGVQQWK